MGVREVEALNMARKIALFNSEAVYYSKNSLMLKTPEIQKNLDTEHEKFTVLLKTNYNKVKSALVLANTKTNDNHNLIKLDVELIYQTLLGDDDESSN